MKALLFCAAIGAASFLPATATAAAPCEGANCPTPTTLVPPPPCEGANCCEGADCPTPPPVPCEGACVPDPCEGGRCQPVVTVAVDDPPVPAFQSQIDYPIIVMSAPTVSADPKLPVTGISSGVELAVTFGVLLLGGVCMAVNRHRPT